MKTSKKSERPILFSSPMIRAILGGWKTRSRRVMQPQPVAQLYSVNSGPEWTYPDPRDPDVPDWGRVRFCPYGGVCDRLWVRESLHERDGQWRYKADETPVTIDPVSLAAAVAWIHHKEASHCPSIFMPRWASRITLELANVRVERLQGISEQDALAEGNRQFSYTVGELHPHCAMGQVRAQAIEAVAYGDEKFPIDAMDATPIAAFRRLWDSVNAKRGYGWESNPWVWVLEFKQLTIDN